MYAVDKYLTIDSQSSQYDGILYQYRAVIKGVLWNSPKSDFPVSAHELNWLHEFGDCTFQITVKSPYEQWINHSELYTSALLSPPENVLCGLGLWTSAEDNWYLGLNVTSAVMTKSSEIYQ